MSEEAQQGIKPSIPTICSRNKISTLSDCINLSRENSIFKSVAETIARSANQRSARKDDRAAGWRVGGSQTGLCLVPGGLSRNEQCALLGCCR